MQHMASSKTPDATTTLYLGKNNYHRCVIPFGESFRSSKMFSLLQLLPYHAWRTFVFAGQQTQHRSRSILHRNVRMFFQLLLFCSSRRWIKENPPNTPVSLFPQHRGTGSRFLAHTFRADPRFCLAILLYGGAVGPAERLECGTSAIRRYQISRQHALPPKLIFAPAPTHTALTHLSCRGTFVYSRTVHEKQVC